MNRRWGKILQTLWHRSRFVSYFYQTVRFAEHSGVPTLVMNVSEQRAVCLYNPDFPGTLSDDELIGLLVHEMLHLVFNHKHRSKPGEDVRLQNLAQDMVVNSFIAERRSTFFSRRGMPQRETPELVLPAGLPRISDSFYRETGISDPRWEEVYRWLKNKPVSSIVDLMFPTRNDDGAKTPGDPAERMRNSLSYDPVPPEYRDNGIVPTRIEGAGALLFEDREGTLLPTGMHLMHDDTLHRNLSSKQSMIFEFAFRDDECVEERAARELYGIVRDIRRTDTTSWKSMLKSLIDYSSTSSEWGYTYSRFNRRYWSGGLYAPGRAFLNHRLLTVAVDVSASMIMKPAEIEAAFGVIEDLLPRFNVNLLCIDETVFVPVKRAGSLIPSRNGGKSYFYKKGDWKYLRTGTSGTTFFAPLFNAYMKGHRETLLVITDGDIYDLPMLHRYSPTLWIISGNRIQPFSPPFGKSIEIGSH